MTEPRTPTEQESLEVAEASREAEWRAPSFVRDLFLGRLRLDLVHPMPRPSPEDEAKTQAFLERLRAFLEAHIDADAIDREGKIPLAVVEGLKELGAFGMKIPEEYGGLGLSQVGYGRAIQMITSADASLTALLSAHQSIGVPQPVKLFGTPEQKATYLPRCARGAISAFALTEPAVGSDPAALRTTAVPTDDGTAYLLNGEKLWCTNGTVAELLVVMARTPGRVVDGKERPQISAFLVETSWPGVEIVHRCRFMGLKAIENAVIRFHNVRVPKENLLWEEGKGLKLALITLNTGRLTLPMSATAAAKAAVEIARRWAAERVQWGAPIGKHDAIAQKIGTMAANAFAIEAMAELSSALADRGTTDIRLEAAIAKLWTTEVGWQILDDLMQIRGGRGYETADSLRARGEAPIPVERMLRDFRINRIFEGSSEIMRLFIAREAVDAHLQVAGDLLRPDLSLAQKAAVAARAGAHYAVWYPSRLVGWSGWPRFREFGPLARHLRFVDRTSRKLARSVVHAMVRFGPKLQYRQSVLFRLVDVGAELFAMVCAIVRAQSLRGTERGAEALRLADVFCRQARLRIRRLFAELFDNEDAVTYRLAQELLAGRYAWLSEGILNPLKDIPPGGLTPVGGRAAARPAEAPAVQVGAGG